MAQPAPVASAPSFTPVFSQRSLVVLVYISGGGAGQPYAMPGMAPPPGMGMPGPRRTPAGMTPARRNELEDHGANAWATVHLRPEVWLTFSAARRMPSGLTTARLGLNFRLQAPVEE
jgi:hypothetical protein